MSAAAPIHTTKSGHAAPAPARSLPRRIPTPMVRRADASYWRRHRLQDRADTSPDAHALAVREIELPRRLHVERVVPAIHVADDAIDPVFLHPVPTADHFLA